MKQRVIDKKQLDIKDLDALFSSLKSKVDDESHNLSVLYSEEVKLGKKLSDINIQIVTKSSELKGLQVVADRISRESEEKKQQALREEEKLRKEKEQWNKEWNKELSSINGELDAKKKETGELTKNLPVLRDKTKSLSSVITSLLDNITKLERAKQQLREQLDKNTVKIDDQKRMFESQEQEYSRKLKELERKLEFTENKLSIQVFKYNGMKDVFLREQQKMKIKRKDLIILARRIEKYYKEKNLPLIKINITDEKT